MPEPSYQKQGVYLGYALDQLLHRKCRVFVPRRNKRHGKDDDKGIIFTKGADPGTGNIVITGRPGSGKSTLGLHIARACAHRPENRCFSAYFSLECTPEETLEKAKLFGWEKDCRIASSLRLGHADRHTDLLRRLLCSNENCPAARGDACDLAPCRAHTTTLPHAPGKANGSVEAKVLLMSLLPRPTTGRSEDHTKAFWTRYAELERLLSACYELRMTPYLKDGKEVANWILPVMVIDSLNMMAEGMPSRDQLLPLFHLFRKYETTGVFLVESSTSTPFDSTLADVVIDLTVKEDQGYSGRFFEVVKSRYRNQVNGRHPYKTVPKPEEGTLTPPILMRGTSDLTPPRSGFVIYPSAHYSVLRGFFEKAGQPPHALKAWYGYPNAPTKYAPGRYWGIEDLDSILPGNLKGGSAVLVEGPSGTYKTNLAATFLARGLELGQSVLLVRLHDDPMIEKVPKGSGTNTNEDDPPRGGPAISTTVLPSVRPWWEQLKPHKCTDYSWQALAPASKATITVWEYHCKDAAPVSQTAKPKTARPRLYEIDLKTGHLLAEEFLHFIREIVIRQDEEQPIARVVLDDVSEIGVAYPFLRFSETSGDLLLPSLVHLMKSSGIDMVVTGTTGIHPQSDDAVARVRAVADTVLRCRYMDVFGRKYVVLEGEGQIASAQAEDTASRSVPATIENEGVDETRRFKVNLKRLRGLVGFDQGQVHRPGISLQLFEETGEIHGRYNRELLAATRAAFAAPEGLEDRRGLGRRGSADSSEVTLAAFGSAFSEAAHESLDIFQSNEPLNRTVICTVDEFDTKRQSFVSSDNTLDTPHPEGTPHQKDASRLKDYYGNVLLLAYRTDIVKGSIRCEGWKDILAQVKKEQCIFWADRTAEETLTCALLDVLLAGLERRKRNPNIAIEDMFSRIAQKKCELLALQELLGISGPWPYTSQPEAAPENAGVYLLWYSQLRELLTRFPGLATRIRVTALPGRGFTGDWRIGVRTGSVSIHLGQAVLNILLRPEEDYKRFALGVGLPRTKKIVDSSRHFLAWPQAPKKMTLQQVIDIHESAWSRKDIIGYRHVRPVLYAAARQLVPVSTAPVPSHVIDTIIVHLPKRVEALTPAAAILPEGTQGDVST